MQDGSGNRWRVLLDARWLVFAVVAAVAVFAFVVSYSHIYDLARGHAQSGAAARLLPLSVDGLIVAATLVMFIRGPVAGTWRRLDWWKPRLTLWAAIGATVAANAAYGLPHGWLSAVISGWPGAAFVAAVEVCLVVAPPRRGVSVAVPVAVPGAPGLAVPSVREIRAAYRCSQGTAEKIRKAVRLAVRDTPAGLPPPGPAGARLNGASRG